MKPAYFVSLLFVLFVTISVACEDLACPFAADDDVVQVYYMTGVMEHFRKWEILFKPLHVYHGAIGFRNLNTRANCTLEYFPPDYFTAVFPLVENPGPSCTLDFHDKGIVVAEDYISDVAWRAGEESVVSEISGKLFNDYLKWAPSYNDTHGKYYLFTVMDKKDGEVFVEQHDCFDFVFNSFKELKSLGAEFDHSVTTNRVFVDLYSEKPDQVDFMDEQKSICSFFDTFQLKNESIYVEFLEIIEFLPFDQKYVWNGQYWKIYPKFPYVAYKYDPVPLP